MPPQPNHAQSPETVVTQLGGSRHGLSQVEADARLKQFGPNTLPRERPPQPAAVFFAQFKSPLIYVLLLAVLASLYLGDWLDASFIFGVLLINACIGFLQEFRAERSAHALQALVSPRARVIRDGEITDIDSRHLVPGDTVQLASGDKVPADMRLVEAHNLHIDESLLTGESVAAAKDARVVLDSDTRLADRVNMAFAGTLVATGRAFGVVVATGKETELGQIASVVLGRGASKAPLVVRMERFTRRVAMAVGLAALAILLISLMRGVPFSDTFPLAIALAVSAIPEGLPVALTVALAVGMERMAKRGVIVRRLVAVEALGSCTYIASDKTGTLTVNQLTARVVQFPGMARWEVTGEGLTPHGVFLPPQDVSLEEYGHLLNRLARTVTLANEAELVLLADEWKAQGDSVDVALLVMARKAGFTRTECETQAPESARIPYESERRFMASLNHFENGDWAFVKGAPETLLKMCESMSTAQGDVPLDADAILAQADMMARDGFRVLAAACGPVGRVAPESFSTQQLTRLCFVGLIGMSDPPRAEAQPAIEACHRAGISVAMVTGDHPVTALALARDLGLTDTSGTATNGLELAEAQDSAAFDRLCATSRVFARVEPEQKLQIVESLQRAGHFVAVTGDGVNDAPALRAAQVGVAMGLRGTDVARETADIIISDDNFSSIVAGVEEGRVAYANVRKVIFLLVSTGAAEIVLFGLTLLAGLPLPLMAVQLLWLNLVTNGLQDVALAFEPGEGHELTQRPRPPGEGIFNRLMVERTLLSAVVMGGVAFVAYQWMLDAGYSLDAARNGVLFLMVLFENIQAFNSRSETSTLFSMGFRRNKLLVFGTLGAQLLHIGALYTPGLDTVLGLQPISMQQWMAYVCLALTLLAASELHKHHWNRRKGNR
jgi:magnesium-transporting ATPase (P-type)